MADAIRLAVIGIGKIARDQHLPAIAADASFTLEALVDRDRPDIAHVAPWFDSFESLLADGPAIDAVAICTPPQVRAPIARAALAAGLHVMLEKPPAGTVSAAAALAAVTRPDQSLFAAWHSREAPMVAAARDWLAGRRIVGGRMRWREDARRWHPGQHWLWRPGGLGVFDPAINGFSILTAICTAPLAVETAELEIPENQNAPIAATLTLECAGQAIAVDLDFREPNDPRWEIALETSDGGRLLLGEGGASLALDGGMATSAANTEYAGLYRRFSRLIAAGGCDLDARPMQLVADAFLVARISRGPAYHP